MDRKEALELVHKNIENKNLRKHIYAVEAVMKKLADHFDQDVETWGLAGLLHDLDYEVTKDDPEKHTFITVDWLKGKTGITEEINHAIRAHAGHVPRDSQMDKAIYCADPVTGFLVACALMHPAKKLESLDLKFMKKRFKEKRFAAGASRENMSACSELGLELDEFLLLARDGMVEIAGDLGL